MNERIKLLAAQAWVGNDQLDAGGYTDLEKFAELIVRECAKAADSIAPSIVSDVIKEHFGVEE